MFNAYDLINLFYISALILFLWSTKTFSLKFSLFEFITAFLFALIFETYNITFSAHYSYPNTYFYIGKVSVEVLIGWYTAYLFGKYWITTIISLTNKPGEIEKLKFLFPILIISSAYISATFVMLIDPFASRTEWWKWFENSPFLGVPIGELYGIFIAVVTISILIIILHKFLRKYFENEIYIVKSLNKFDLLVFILYEIFCLVGVYITVKIANSNSDVLMGVIVVYLATQIIPFITLILYLSSDFFDNDFRNLYNRNKAILSSFIVLIVIMTIIAGIISIFSIIPETKIFLPSISSFHMIMTQFTLVLGALSITLYSKYRTIKP